jgi:hypothetical protein
MGAQTPAEFYEVGANISRLQHWVRAEYRAVPIAVMAAAPQLLGRGDGRRGQPY